MNNKSIGMLILLNCSLFAQTRFLINTGVSVREQAFASLDRANFPDYYSKPGFNLGIGVEHSFFPWLAVSPILEYNHYFFHKYYQLIGFEEQVAGSSGGPMQIIRPSLEVKYLYGSNRPSGDYISTGVGYTIEKLSDINVLYSYLGGPVYSRGAIRQANTYYWAHSMGLGYRGVVSRILDWDVCLKYYSNYRGRFHLSFNMGVVYTFEAQEKNAQ
jgi:hypothetical protein